MHSDSEWNKETCLSLSWDAWTLMRIPQASAVWITALGASVHLPQSTELLLQDRGSYEDMKRASMSSGLAMGTQVEVPDLTIRSCDFWAWPSLGFSLFTWTAGGMGLHTLKVLSSFRVMSLCFPPLLKQEKPLNFILTQTTPWCY